MLAGCAPDGSDLPVATEPVPVAVTNAPTASTTGVTVFVIALDNNFRAQDSTARVGDTVQFTNKGKNDHDVIPGTGHAWGVQVAEFHPGDVYSYAFTAPGVYPYYCTIHGTNTKGMVGTITVTG
jgi:plastocyanin